MKMKKTFHHAAFCMMFLLLAGVAPASGPPREDGVFRSPELVDLNVLDPSIKYDIRYATANNFLGRSVYPEARALLQRPAAEAVVRVNAKLKAEGYGLMVFDGYRPWSVTKIFWDETPDDKKQFVADPSKGSKHNRGCSVDLTLVDLKTGKEVEMPSGYDEMTERAYPDYPHGSADSRRLRDLLRKTMELEGFTVYEFEWWHYDFKDWKEYAILDIPFSSVPRSR